MQGKTPLDVRHSQSQTDVEVYSLSPFSLVRSYVSPSPRCQVFRCFTYKITQDVTNRSVVGGGRRAFDRQDTQA